MNTVKIIVVLFIKGTLLSISGCIASMDVTYDEKGRVKYVKSRGLQDTLIEQGDVKIHRKAAWKFWPENLFTVLK